MLSAGIAKAMHDQLQLDDDVVQNDTAITEMLKAAPRPSHPTLRSFAGLRLRFARLAVRILTMSM